MKSETFRNIPKVSESFGYQSLHHTVFTYGFVSVMSFEVIWSHTQVGIKASCGCPSPHISMPAWLWILHHTTGLSLTLRRRRKCGSWAPHLCLPQPKIKILLRNFACLFLVYKFIRNIPIFVLGENRYFGFEMPFCLRILKF